MTFAWKHLPLILLGLIILLGCPRRFAPAATPEITSSDPKANEALTHAIHLFDAGKFGTANSAFQSFQQSYPQDPLVALALVYRGRIALTQNQLSVAQRTLALPAQRSEEDAIGRQARYYLGIVHVRLGDYVAGEKLLLPFLDIISPEDRPALLATLALAEWHLQRLPQAVSFLAELFEGPSSRPAEKAYAREMLENIINESPADRLKSLYASSRSGSIVAVLVGKKLAVLEMAAGHGEQAQRILKEISADASSYQITLPFALGPSTSAKPSIGLLLPFSGKYRAASRELLLGAIAASDILNPKKPSHVVLAIGDSSKNLATEAQRLIQQEQVIAIVGALGAHEAATIQPIADSAGVPFLSLAKISAAPKASKPAAFCLLPNNEQRAQALAVYALKSLKRHRFLIMAPQTPYGQKMLDSFSEAVKYGGGEITSKVLYPPNTISFLQLAKSISSYDFDAIFIPDTARTLALIAPALARAGFWSLPSTSQPSRGRGFQLLSTADGLSEQLVQTASRYIQGAILAPGFYPDDNAASSGPHLQQYEQDFNHLPSVLEALGFDAVNLIRPYLSRGLAGRTELLSDLRNAKEMNGLTGKIRFNIEGTRIDPPLLYRVNGQEIMRIQYQ